MDVCCILTGEFDKVINFQFIQLISSLLPFFLEVGLGLLPCCICCMHECNIKCKPAGIVNWVFSGAELLKLAEEAFFAVQTLDEA